MPPRVTASARQASARCFNPNFSRRLTGMAVDARSMVMVSITALLAFLLFNGGALFWCRLLRSQVVATPGACVGRRSRGRTKIRLGEKPTTLAVHQHRIGLLPSPAVGDDDTGTLGGEMPIAPGEQRPQHWPKVAAGLRQHIFV